MKSFLAACFILVSFGSFSQKKVRISVDSLKKELSLCKEDSCRLNLYNSLSWAFVGKDLKVAKEYSDSAFSIVSAGYSNKKFVSRARFELMAAEANNNEGTLLYYRGDYSAAIEYFLKSLQVFERYNLHEKTSSLYNNIGSMFMSQKNYKDALKNFKKAEDIKRSLYAKDSLNPDYAISLARTYNNLGSLFAQQKTYEEALRFFSDALHLYQKVGNKRGIAINKNNVGETYLYLNETEKAEKLFRESLEIFEEINDPSGIVIALNSLGQCLADTDPKQAKDFLLRSEKICKEYGMREDLKNAYQFISTAYRKLGNYEKAYKYIENYMQISDSLINETITKQSLEMTERFESEKKEKQIALLHKDVALKEAENKKNQFLLLIFIVGSLLILVILGSVVYAFLIKKKANEKLQSLNTEIQNQKALVDEKQKEILDSIHYARRIQNTLLATKESIAQVFPENFIYFKPKDIVSGDFYWTTYSESHINELQIPKLTPNKQTAGKEIEKITDDRYFYLAVCDSTGHGVPGAFMSLLNIGFLSEAINEKHYSSPDKIFNYVRERLVGSISKEGQQDGFDGILMRFDPAHKTIAYVASNNTPLLVSNGRYNELNKDRMPVGKGEKNEPFRLHSLEYNDGDMLYLFTDGIADQFGGPHGKKFKYRKLYELLENLSSLPCNNQLDALNTEFENWKGNLEQVDDVCLIGLRL